GRIPALEHFASQGLGPMLPAEVSARYPDKRKLLSVRHPVDRVSSLWRNFCRHHPITAREKHRRIPIAGMSPQELLDFIRAHPFEDRHWIPQSMHWVRDAELVPFHQMFERLRLPAAKVNVTDRLPTDPLMPSDEIIRHYFEDWLLWDLAQ